MTPICMSDVASHFAEYVDLVVNRGERFTLLRDGKPVAELGPVLTTVRLEDLPTFLASLPCLTRADAEALSRNPDADPEEPSALEESCAS
jgi:antitoxin (DNA-binding transcriptional repressor) of toxin-antitoxin stability system